MLFNPGSISRTSTRHDDRRAPRSSSRATSELLPAPALARHSCTGRFALLWPLTGGVETWNDGVKAILAGAHAMQGRVGASVT